MNSFRNHRFSEAGLFILLLLTAVTPTIAEDGIASAYSVKLYGHEIRQSSTIVSEIALDIEFRNTIDPILVFDYDVNESLLFSDVSKNAFLLVDGQYALTMQVSEDTGFIPDSFVLRNESSKLRGIMVFACPVKEPKSMVFYYYHDKWGKVVVPVKGTASEGWKPQTSGVKANEKLQLAIGDHGVWKAPQGVSPKAGHRFYSVDVWGKSLWKREVAAYNLDPAATPKDQVEVDYPFIYHQAELALSLLAEDAYAYLIRPDLSECGASLLFIPDQWTKVRLVYEIPEKTGKLDLSAQFVKTGLSDEGADYLDTIDFPLDQGKPLDHSLPNSTTVEDVDGANHLRIEIALVPDVSTFGLNASAYLGVHATFRNVGAEPGMMTPIQRFWFSGEKEIRPVMVAANPYQPPENLYLTLNQPKSLLLLYPKSSFDGVDNLMLNYSGIGEYFVFNIDLKTGLLTPNESQQQPSEQPQRSSVVTPAPTNTVQTPEGSTSPNARDVSVTSEPEKPFKAVVPFTEERPVPYHAEAEVLTQNDLSGMGNPPFASASDYTYGEFESVNGKVSTLEAEANDEFKAANAFGIGQVICGSIEEEGNDYWSFSVKGKPGDNERFSIKFAVDTSAETMEGAYLYLYDAEENQILRIWAETVYDTQNLGLKAGDYYLRVANYSDQPAADYFIKVEKTTATTLVEREVNDRQEDATPLALGEQVEGDFSEYDRADFYRVEFSEKDSVNRWEALLQSDQPKANFSFRLVQDDSETVFWGDGQGQAVMGDLSPVPGTYFVEVQCATKTLVHYRLKIVDRGPRPTGWEREPNDTLKSRTIPVIETIDDSAPELQGRFQGKYGDYFALNVQEANRMYTITLGGDAGKQISYHDTHRGELRRVYSSKEMRASLVDMRLPLGLNYFAVQGDPGDYAINVETTAIPGDTYEWEPNDSDGRAQLLSMGKEFSGRLLDTYDDDHYRVVVHQAMNYRFDLNSGEGGIVRMNLRSDGFRTRDWQTDPETLALSESCYLLPGNYLIRMEAREPSLGLYSIRVSSENPFAEATEAPQVTLEAKDEKFVAAAFADDYQSVIQHLVVTNRGSEALQVDLEAKASHHAVRPEPEALRAFLLPSGASKDIRLRWTLDPQIWGDDVIGLYVGAKVSGNEVANAESALLLSNNAVPVGVIRNKHALDERIAGGFNLNLLDLGAEAIVPDAATYPDPRLPDLSAIKYLMDGALARYSFFGFQAISKLVGDGNVPIVGTTIDLHGRGSLWESAKAFAIDLSEDGKQFTEVYSGQLEPFTGTQSFLFDQARKGKYARIRVLSTQGEEVSYPHLGEWRIISQPGVTIPRQEDINLLKKEFGGHTVYEGERFRVYGFQHGRAARLGKIRWENRAASKNSYRNTPSITVEASMNSPVGPWTTVATFDLSEADGESLITEQPFPDEPWARFVKVSWPAPEEGTYQQREQSFEVYEKRVDNDYRSVMGEWGNVDAKGCYEYTKQDETTDPVELKPIVSSRKSPYRLIPDTWIDSVAWVKEHWEDWYAIDAVSVRKKLQFSVSGSPFVKVSVELFDGQGNPVEVREVNNTATRKNFIFWAEANQQYLVHVYEPKRSIIYLWDVSGSMSAFIPSIENAVLKFSQEIDPVQEKIQLLPFDEPPRFLLDDWKSDSYLLQNTVRNYEAPSSSYAHLNLLAATEKLKDEEGTRAAIVITDCESPRGVNEQLWKALLDVKPSVFTFQTSDQPNSWGVEQDDMQDWAAVGGGFYYNTRETYELDTAFARVQAYLRRPAPYRIRLTAPVLMPSYIEVVDAREKSTLKDPSKDGVLLIIDASASMRESLPDGQMKVAAAKAVIQDLVDNYLPKEIGFGLRVFGHRGGEDCKSELMIPVSPLDPGLVKQKLMFVRSSSLGNTALAESLTWAKEDFAEIEGNKRVVVLTDGEETCRGDPPAVIADLASEGFQITINIVGFTLAEERIKNEYSNWIASTGGKYFDAQDADALGEALKKATTPVELPEFQILTMNGDVVAAGKVGDAPIKVDAGTYRVKILDQENPTEQQIEVYEKTVTVKYE